MSLNPNMRQFTVQAATHNQNGGFTRQGKDEMRNDHHQSSVTHSIRGLVFARKIAS